MESSSEPSDPPRPHLSIQSPQLQDEFLKERQKRLASRSDISPTSCPFSPAPSDSPPSPSQSPSWRSRDSLRTPSLSSPELLSELKKNRTHPLRQVPAKNGLTIVFSGRGRQGSGSSPTT